jgi:MFS transporter, SP family, general alpha glucoside:H+ symporter
VIILLAGGVASLIPFDAQLWTTGSLLIVLTFLYDLTLGPVCYIMVAEIPSTRLRVKTVVLARLVYNLGGILTGFLAPEMLDPIYWNWKENHASYLPVQPSYV